MTDPTVLPPSAAAPADSNVPGLTPGAAAILASPAFQTLRARRNGLAVMLTAAMLAIYYGFILLIAFAPSVLATPVGDGPLSVGIPLGLAVIVSAIVLTGIYVWRANSEFDGLSRQALESVR